MRYIAQKIDDAFKSLCLDKPLRCRLMDVHAHLALLSSTELLSVETKNELESFFNVEKSEDMTFEQVEEATRFLRFFLLDAAEECGMKRFLAESKQTANN